MSVRNLVVAGMVAGAVINPAVAAPLPARAWPECKALKPGVRFDQAVLKLWGRGRRTGFAIVDDLPVAFYAFRRNAHTCRVQVEEGMVLAAPVLK